MRENASAYAVLGLDQGADRAAVEEAYRRLIKIHHPDRLGGDAGRAAEINQAYFELRKRPPPHPEVIEAAAPARRRPRPRQSYSRRPKRRSRRRLWPVLALALAVMVTVNADRLMDAMPQWMAPSDRASALARGTGRALPRTTSLDDPLTDGAISAALEEAAARRGDPERQAQQSRDCHRELRADPDLQKFDHCAAFDAAVAAIEDLDPLRDGGPFGASAVTARQMTAASLLSDDYLAIERRLDRIRTQIEMALALPPLPAVRVQREVSVDDAAPPPAEPPGDEQLAP